MHSGNVLILDPDSAADRHAARDLLDQISAPLRVVPGNHDVGEPGGRPWGGLGVTSARVAAFAGVFGPGHWLETVGGYAVIGLSSEIMSSGLPEEQAQWDWLETVPTQVGDRPVLIFCHKPVWPSVPGPQENSVAIPGAERYRLLRILAGMDVKVFAHGHLHQFVIGQYGKALTVTAPSVAFANRGHHDVTGPGAPAGGRRGIHRRGQRRRCLLPLGARSGRRRHFRR